MFILTESVGSKDSYRKTPETTTKQWHHCQIRGTIHTHNARGAESTCGQGSPDRTQDP